MSRAIQSKQEASVSSDKGSILVRENSNHTSYETQKLFDIMYILVALQYLLDAL